MARNVIPHTFTAKKIWIPVTELEFYSGLVGTRTPFLSRRSG